MANGYASSCFSIVYAAPSASGVSHVPSDAHRGLVEPLDLDAQLMLPAHLGLQFLALRLVESRTQDGDVREEVVHTGLGHERLRDLRVHPDAFQQEARVLDGVAVPADRSQFARRAAGRAARDRVALHDDGAYPVLRREEVRGGTAYDSAANDDGVRGPGRGHGRAAAGVMASPW